MKVRFQRPGDSTLTALLTQVRQESTPRLTAPLSRALKRLSHRAGITAALGGGRPGAAAILFFHKVQRRSVGLWGESALSVESFEEQVACIARDYRPLALSALVRLLRERQPIPDRSVVLTFDDGYRHNLLLAAPLLRRYGVPATLFVTTGLVGTPGWMWGYELEEMLLRVAPRIFGAASGDAQLRELCGLGLSRRDTASACVELLKLLPEKRKNAILERLRCAFPVEVDDENRFLSWDEVRRIRDFGVEIGAHTVSHPLLDRISLGEAEREMRESKERLERELDEPIRLFAYPNGNSTPELARIAEAHFDAAVTTQPGIVEGRSGLATLPRIYGTDRVEELSYELTRHFRSVEPERASV